MEISSVVDTHGLNDDDDSSPAMRRRRFLRQGAALGALLLLSPVSACAARPRVDVLKRHPWLREFATAEGFDHAWLNEVLGDLEPYPRAVELMDSQAEAMPYHKYRKLFLTDKAVHMGAARLKEHREILARAEKRFGVPPAVVVTLWGIESRYGSYMGRHPVLRTLFTLATGYPRRADFFREELRHFLHLCRQEKWYPAGIYGSYAGAIGQVQMIPSSVRKYAVDFNDDGKLDIFNDKEDALGSIASFLKAHGWLAGGPMAVKVDNPGQAKPLDKLDAMPPYLQWYQQGVRLAKGEKRPPDDTPAALIELQGKDAPLRYMVFTNFHVVTRWNRSYRFAMVVKEFSERLERMA